MSTQSPTSPVDCFFVSKDLNLPVEVVVCETTREADGLAMSSRNAYMSAEERAAAPVVYMSLQAAADARKRAVEAGRYGAVNRSCRVIRCDAGH